MISTPRVCQDPGPVRGAFRPAPEQQPALASGLVGADKLQTLPSLASRALSRSLHPAPSSARKRWRPGQSLPRTTRTRLSAAPHQY